MKHDYGAAYLFRAVLIAALCVFLYLAYGWSLNGRYQISQEQGDRAFYTLDTRTGVIAGYEFDARSGFVKFNPSTGQLWVFKAHKAN